jgi:hypothetical protein
MIDLDAEERAEYDRLRLHYGGSPASADSPTLAAMAKARVGRRRERQQALLARLCRALALSWIDRLAFYGALRALRRITMKQLGNWQSTLIGFVLALAVYLQTNGAKFPETKAEWGNALIAAALQALGLVSKDAATGSGPGARS